MSPLFSKGAKHLCQIAVVSKCGGHQVVAAQLERVREMEQRGVLAAIPRDEANLH
ncbi:MAG: hypothetical protein V3U43_03365 [Pseudomonadales bacterium]